MHDVTHQFSSIGALWLALYHEDDIPDDEEYNLDILKENNRRRSGWFPHRILMPCMLVLRVNNGFRSGVMESNHQRVKRKKKKKNSRKQRKTKADDREEELESIFQQLKEKHESKYSGPQLRLWARMTVAKTHDDMDEPPKVPMITEAVQKSQPKDSLTDVFVSAATVFAKVFSLSQMSAVATGVPPTPPHPPPPPPGKKVDLRMKNLEQLRQLQKLLEDGILSQEEFESQKKIVVLSLNNLA